MEHWVDIPQYEGAYQVSDMGRIRSLTRRRLVNNCYGGVSYRTDQSRIIIPHSNGNGYQYVSLRDGETRKNFYVHRLVAQAFCNKPQGKDYVNHIDYNRANNAAANLEWCTAKENIAHSKPKMRHPRNLPAKTNTGLQYISRTEKGNFRVCIYNSAAKHDKTYRTLQEAIGAVAMCLGEYFNQYMGT